MLISIRLLFLLISLNCINATIFNGFYSARQDFQRRLVNSTKLNIAFEFPETPDLTFDNLDLTFKQELADIFDDMIHYLIDICYQSTVTLFDFTNLSMEILRISQEFKDSGDEFNNEFPVKTDSVRHQIKILSEKAVEKWDKFLVNYEKIEGFSEPKNILINIQLNFFNRINNKMVTKFVNQFSYESHPLIEVLFEMSETGIKSELINKLNEFKNMSTEQIVSYDASIKQQACDFINFLKNTKLVGKQLEDAVIDYIKKNIEPNYQNKLLMAFLHGLLDGIIYVLKPLCGSNPNFFAPILFNAMDKYLPYNNPDDYQKQYRLFLFIQWIEFILRDGLDIKSSHSLIKNSAQQLMDNLKDNISKITLNDSLKELEKFSERYRQLSEDIKKELEDIFGLKHNGIPLQL